MKGITAHKSVVAVGSKFCLLILLLNRLLLSHFQVLIKTNLIAIKGNLVI